MTERFEKLRGCNLIPTGIRRNIEHLQTSQIVACVLSLTEKKASFAGLTTKSLISLKPVGGVEASFYSSITFGQAIQQLLDNQKALDCLIDIRISNNEFSKKVYGRASITYYDGDIIKQAYYVHKSNLSILQKGSELTFCPNDTHLSYISEHIFTPKIWKNLKQKLDREKKFPPKEYSIPQEDKDFEEQQRERNEILGINKSSYFLNMAISTQATWVKSETPITFEGKQFILFPRTREYSQSIHIDLHHNKISSDDARERISRFLSLLTWCDDQPSTLQDGWAGNPVPVAVPKTNLGSLITDIWVFNKKLPECNKQQIALSLYRQGRNAEKSSLNSYAILSYYKIIEIKYDNHYKDESGKKNNKTMQKFFREKYKIIKENYQYKYYFEKFEDWFSQQGNLQGTGLGEFFHDSCRNAATHARMDREKEEDRIDPDNINDGRLIYAVPIMRLFARYFIETELEVSTSPY